MIPITFDPVGTGGSPSYGELSDFQSNNGTQWVDAKPAVQIMIYPSRWHSDDTDPANWFIRIVHMNEFNQQVFKDLTCAYTGGWITQPVRYSPSGPIITSLLLHNGYNILPQLMA